MSMRLSKKGVILFFSLLLLIVFFGILSSESSHAFDWGWGLSGKADEEKIKGIYEEAYRKKTGRDELPPETYKKKEVKQGGIVLKNAAYPLEHYEGLSTASGLGELTKSNIVSFSNALFWLSKFMYQGIDFGINLMSAQSILDDWVDTTLSMAKGLWEEAKKEYLLLVVIVLGAVLMWQMMAELNLLKGLKTLGMFVGIFVLATFFFNHGGTVIKEFNAVNNNTQASVLNVGTFITGMSDEIPEDQTKEGVTAMIRNTYFNLAVLRPYLLMNYGTTNEEALLKDDPNRLDNILKLSRSYLYEEKLKAAIKEEAGDGKNDYMTTADLGVNSKFGMSLGSIVLTLGVGIPLLILSLANFLVQIMVLACVLILGISFFVSLIPKFRQSFVRPLVKGIGYIISQAFLVIFILFVLLIMVILDSIIPPTTSGGFLVNSLVLAFILWYLLKNKDEIVSMITGGRVQLQTNSASRVMNGLHWGSNWIQRRGLRKSFERGQNRNNDGASSEEKERKERKTPPKYRFTKNQSDKRQLPNGTDPSGTNRENPQPKQLRRTGQSKRSKQAPVRRQMGNRQTNKPSQLREIPIQKKRPIGPRTTSNPRQVNPRSNENNNPPEKRFKKMKPTRPSQPTHPKRTLPEKTKQITKETPKVPIQPRKKEHSVPPKRKGNLVEPPKRRPNRNERRDQ